VALAQRDAELAVERGKPAPRLYFNAARVHALAAARLPGASAARAEARSARLLARALERVPAAGRPAFWKDHVEADDSLATVRRHPLLGRYRPPAQAPREVQP
jgi:hypothetical protein